MLFSTFIAGVLAIPAVAAHRYGGLNGYFGQKGTTELRSYCDALPQYITLGFVNKAPENDPSGYPGTNFGAHCWADTYTNPSGVKSQLLSECRAIRESITYCQGKGVKVLLSIGGQYNEEYSNYKVTTQLKGRNFADFLYNAFGPYNASWTGPRPFDTATEHVAVDGFDFDLEAAFEMNPYIAMADQFRVRNSKLIITAAPQCPLQDQYFYLKKFIQQAQLDALFVQFYNNPVCDAIAGNGGTGEKFNYDDWEAILDKSNKSKKAKLYIGIPANPITDPNNVDASAGSGYITPARVKELICQNKDKPHWGGISIWDMYLGRRNVINNKNYLVHIYDALTAGCGAIPSSKKVARGEEVSTTLVTTIAPNATATTSVEMTTSTVYSTQTHTLTKCPPEVVDCPAGGYVTTEVVPIYTTVCPVSDVTTTETESASVTESASTFSTVTPSGTCAGTGCPGVPTASETWTSKPPSIPTTSTTPPPGSGAASGLSVGLMAVFAGAMLPLLL